jgi:Lrp/AsnC family transcriptional regulator, leucine-responsive regulatory protein
MAEASLDRTDLRILEELQRDGRIANAELAERVQLSPSPCLRRVARMESSGVIAGYAAKLDAARIGLGLQAFVRVQLARHDRDAIARFAELVQEWPEVVACYALTGDMDYLMQVWVQDLAHFSTFLMDRLMNAAGVDDVNSSFVLREVKPAGALPLGHLA